MEVPTPTFELSPSKDMSGYMVDVVVAKENEFTEFGIVEVEEFEKFVTPAFTVRRSVWASPTWRLPMNPALERNVEEASAVNESVDSSPRVVEPVLKSEVEIEKTDVVANVDVESFVWSPSKVDEAEVMRSPMVDVGEMESWVREFGALVVHTWSSSEAQESFPVDSV